MGDHAAGQMITVVAEPGRLVVANPLKTGDDSCDQDQAHRLRGDGQPASAAPDRPDRCAAESVAHRQAEPIGSARAHNCHPVPGDRPHGSRLMSPRQHARIRTTTSGWCASRADPSPSGSGQASSSPSRPTAPSCPRTQRVRRDICYLGSISSASQLRSVVAGSNDMSLFQRAHDIVAAKANKALDAAENPNEMLDYSYQQMLDHITQVRRALVDITASKKQLELQEQQLQHSIDHLDDQAKAALGQGRDDLAREALSRKATAQQQIEGMEPQRQQLDDEEDKMEQTLNALQQRVNTFRSQKEVMKAQYTAASAMTSVNEDAAGISESFSDSGAALQRAQDKIASMQARAAATDELLQSGVLEDVGGNTDDIQKELDEAGANAEVDKELAALKAQIARPPATPELPPGS